MTIAIIQARMSSSRLPGKVMMEINGKPMLWHVVNRVKGSRLIDSIVVATTDQSCDDPIDLLCRDMGVACFRGDERDVLDRYYRAAKTHAADVIVRITSDCPLIDPGVIDRIIDRFRQGDCDYAATSTRYSFPEGLDTEVFSMKALERAFGEAKQPSEREHVTPFIRLSGHFRTAYVENSPDLSGKRYRWSVDEAADLKFAREVYRRIGAVQGFGQEEVLALLDREPDLCAINSRSITNEGYYKSLFDQAAETRPSPLKLTKSMEWQKRAQKVIPGGALTFSKSPIQYVQGVSPVYLVKGKGCRAWDADGNEYIDYVQGLLTNILGYANDEVNSAAMAQLAAGHSFSLSNPLEVELAERLTRLIPCAEMVRFAKNGSDATSGAIRAARALTGRERIACSGYHGWQDWYIGSTTRSLGVPNGVRELTHTFPYNDLRALEKLIESHPGQFAAIMMEPTNFVSPAPGFLEGVRELATRHNIVLIFDEICTGFRFGLGGAQKRYGVTPDMACFGKAMGNGFPIACVVGRTAFMSVFEEIFFSFTFAGETASLAAAMKVIDILEQTDALARLEHAGRVLQDGFNALAKQAGISDRYFCEGQPVWSIMKFKNAAKEDSLLERSLFQQEVVKRGILCLVTHNTTSVHDDIAVEKTLRAYAETFKTLAKWLSDSDPSRHLEGKMIQPIFKVR